jgi:hypothetical protein
MSSRSGVIALNVPLSTALFTVDTRDGLKTSNGFVVEPQSPYNINIYKNQQLFSGAVQRIALTEVVIPWNVPNVNPTNNVLFLEKDDETVYEVEISPGFYVPSDIVTGLAEAIQADLNVNNALGSSTWTVTFNAGEDARFRISSGDPDVQFRILPKLGQGKGVSTQYAGFAPSPARTSTLATMMGLDYTGAGYAANVQGSWASMLYTRYVDIVSSILCKHQNVRDTSTNYLTGQNIVARIYISNSDNKPIVQTVGGETVYNIAGTSPFVLREQFQIPKDINWDTSEFLPSCNIQLKDEFGNQLYSESANPILSTAPAPANFYMYCGNSGFVQLSFLISEAGSPSGKYTQF